MIRRAMLVAAMSAFAVIGFAGAASADTLDAGSIVAKHAGDAATAAATVDATVGAADVNTTVAIMRAKAAAWFPAE